jgi:hypothetical protein
MPSDVDAFFDDLQMRRNTALRLRAVLHMRSL